MLVLGLLVWHLAEYDPAGDDTKGYFPWVVRGLPYGAYQSLVAYWVPYIDRPVLRVPGSTTLFGAYEAAGRFDRGTVGYIAAWKQAGIARTHQPCAWRVPRCMRGRTYLNKDGDKECWAFVELRLRIRMPIEDGVLPMGPPPPAARRRRPPPPDIDREELGELVDEVENEWCSSSPPSRTRESTAPAAPAIAALSSRNRGPAREPYVPDSSYWSRPDRLNTPNACDGMKPEPSGELPMDHRAAMEAVRKLTGRGMRSAQTTPPPPTELNYRSDPAAVTRAEALENTQLRSIAPSFEKALREYEEKRARDAASRAWIARRRDKPPD
jgi:hypothetical protein